MNTVTGRDGYIMGKALCWALEYAKSLPEEQREWSDEEDMLAILNQNFPGSHDAFKNDRAFRALMDIGFDSEAVTRMLNVRNRPSVA